MRCPKCGNKMIHQEGDWDTNVEACYVCESCNVTVEDHYEPEGDEVI